MNHCTGCGQVTWHPSGTRVWCRQPAAASDAYATSVNGENFPGQLCCPDCLTPLTRRPRLRVDGRCTSCRREIQPRRHRSHRDGTARRHAA